MAGQEVFENSFCWSPAICLASKGLMTRPGVSFLWHLHSSCLLKSPRSGWVFLLEFMLRKPARFDHHYPRCSRLILLSLPWYEVLPLPSKPQQVSMQTYSQLSCLCSERSFAVAQLFLPEFSVCVHPILLDIPTTLNTVQHTGQSSSQECIPPPKSSFKRSESISRTRLSYPAL